MDTAREDRTGLEAWHRAELPAPPPTQGLKILGVIGPGVILLGSAIGSGEWLLGPAVLIKYGLALLWVSSAAIFLQTIFNTELVRYTLYTGEPAVVGFMRTRPHARFWALVYAALYVLQAGWPAWAGAAAGAAVYMATGSLPGEAQAGLVQGIGTAIFAACVAILLVGRRIERTLELLNWVMVATILIGLAALCVVIAPAGRWLGVAAGFVGWDLERGGFALLPAGADWFLLAAFAAYSGVGGVGNLTLSNWARDKGFGMGGVVGFIPAAVAGRAVPLAHRGSVFLPAAESLAKWRGWWRIVRADQWGVFFIGAMLGMALPAILYTAVIPSGEDIRGPGIAARLADAIGPGTWLALAIALMGVWLLFKAQLDILEGTVRAVTDILWTGSRRMRRWSRDDVRWVYYGVLALFVVWGVIALGLAQPIVLLQLSANVGGVVMVLASLHILRINTTLLPPELRPPLWRRLALVATALFYGAFVTLWLTSWAFRT
ncbi:MAG TPA: Nramp family divalent metal transporter [Novosphingobium sp.]|nr:Nramp family divalent metal transporter [Novosphingobium sp.]